jgi:hypothetical protein
MAVKFILVIKFTSKDTLYSVEYEHENNNKNDETTLSATQA